MAQTADLLERGDFLATLRRHIDFLASTPLDTLPAPRVLAVDAVWGSGKSWVAQALLDQLKNDEQRSVLIDAFRYDHHDDVFGVIAAAIMAELKPTAVVEKKLLQAAGAVLKIGAPLAVRAVVNLGLSAANLDSDAVTKAIEKAEASAETFSADTVSKLFKKYTETENVQARFIGSLSEITRKLDKPLVVIIDELDRCKPSFALEVLERIKHIFSAEKLVFVLFWNKESLEESIRHTYGQNTDAESYLSKFVSIQSPLPMPRRSSRSQIDYSDYVPKKMMQLCAANINQVGPFLTALTEISDVLRPTLRIVEKAIMHFRIYAEGAPDISMVEFAYLALINVSNQSTFRKLLAKDKTTALEECARFPTPDFSVGPNSCGYIWAQLRFMSDPNKFLTAHSNRNSAPMSPDQQYITSNLHLGQGNHNGPFIFQEAADYIDAMLTSARRMKIGR